MKNRFFTRLSFMTVGISICNFLDSHTLGGMLLSLALGIGSAFLGLRFEQQARMETP